MPSPGSNFDPVPRHEYVVSRDTGTSTFSRLNTSLLAVVNTLPRCGGTLAVQNHPAFRGQSNVFPFPCESNDSAESLIRALARELGIQQPVEISGGSKRIRGFSGGGGTRLPLTATVSSSEEDSTSWRESPLGKLDETELSLAKLVRTRMLLTGTRVVFCNAHRLNHEPRSRLIRFLRRTAWLMQRSQVQGPRILVEGRGATRHDLIPEDEPQDDCRDAFVGYLDETESQRLLHLSVKETRLDFDPDARGLVIDFAMGRPETILSLVRAAEAAAAETIDKRVTGDLIRSRAINLYFDELKARLNRRVPTQVRHAFDVAQNQSVLRKLFLALALSPDWTAWRDVLSSAGLSADEYDTAASELVKVARNPSTVVAAQARFGPLLACIDGPTSRHLGNQDAEFALVDPGFRAFVLAKCFSTDGELIDRPPNRAMTRREEDRVTRLERLFREMLFSGRANRVAAGGVLGGLVRRFWEGDNPVLRDEPEPILV
jgi:hypothetical protein